jgi:hypothetical protein
MPSGDKPDTVRLLVIPWRTVAWVSASAAVGSLASLVVVATTNGSNALATVALALAVLSFLIQIIVFLGQSAIQGSQTMRNEQIFGATLKLLAEIQSTANTTQEALREQKEVLLPALLEKQALQTGPPPGQTTPAVPPSEPANLSYPPPIRDRPEITSRLDLLTTLPPDREIAERDAKLIHELSPITVDTLRRLGRDEMSSLMSPGNFGPGLYRHLSGTQEALSRGLVREIDPPMYDPSDPSYRVFQLTPDGRELARYWASWHPRPDYYRDLELPTEAFSWLEGS